MAVWIAILLLAVIAVALLGIKDAITNGFGKINGQMDEITGRLDELCGPERERRRQIRDTESGIFK